MTGNGEYRERDAQAGEIGGVSAARNVSLPCALMVSSVPSMSWISELLQLYCFEVTHIMEVM